MARKDRKTAREDRLGKTRQRIEGARRRLHRGLLGPLLNAVVFQECEGSPGDPLLACVDPEQGVVWLNPYSRPELGEAEWTFILAHELLHLGLRHGPRRLHRDPMVWNLACDHAADNLLHTFKIGRPPHDFATDTSFAGMQEEEIYEALLQDRRATASIRTFAGPRRADLVRREIVRPVYAHNRRRTDYETLLAEGIRQAVDQAVVEAAETMGQADTRPNLWRPAEAARKWVMNEMPLLGALAAQLRIVADAELCERMDIGIAAVNGFLGEIYLHPGRGLTQAELVFVYVHELLHAALLHHSRGRGRDPHLWNLACDFVINDWLIEMGVGRAPAIGLLYDPRLKGMSSDEVYDLLAREPG